VTRISDFLSDDHSRCDQFFVSAEKLVSAREWEKAQAVLDTFLKSINEHFTMEEGVLFPAFEEVMGGGGPTFVMRHEHEQMRHLFRDMSEALSARDDADFLGISETLLILMQQHNMKEEQMLYPMADRVLTDGSEIVQRMRGMISE
jgi:hemerythrin-like domain-containing protein